LSLGTARCGPARRVVWGGGEKNSPLPDYLFFYYQSTSQNVNYQFEYLRKAITRLK